MDGILFIMFGAVISMTTALTFMEARRIRKQLESQSASVGSRTKTAEV
jgi:hypothetical protein